MIFWGRYTDPFLEAIAIEAHMFQRRTFKFFVSLIGLFLVLASPALIWPDYLDSPLGLALAIPYLSIYLFDQIGIPGLLQNNGACGWGWCAPTAFGWVFLVTFWLSVTWLLAWGLSRLPQPSGEADQANCPATQPDDQAH